MVAHQQVSGADPGESSLHLGVVILVVLFGVGLLAHPLYLWPHHSQTPYTPTISQQVSGESLDQSAVIEYENLPQAAQESFDATRTDEYKPLWSGEDDRAIDVMEEHRYVQYQGTYYEYGLSHGDTPALYADLIRGLLTSLGVFLVTWGSLVGYTRTWRPLSPLRSLLFVSTTLVALVMTQTYDVVYSGAPGSLPLPNTFLSLIPVLMGFLGVGSLLRRRGWRSLVPVAGISIFTLVAGAIVFDAPAILPLILGLILTVAGAPWMTVGYALTTGSEPL